MIRRAARVALVTLVVDACVPAAADMDPRGGVGLTIRPSPGSRGESFTTSDGWTIHVDLLAVQAFVVAVPQDGKEGGFGGSYVFLASTEQQFVVRAVPVGPATTTLTLTRRLLETTGDLAGGNDAVSAADQGIADPPAEHGVDPTIDARFNRPADGDDPSGTNGDDDDDDSDAGIFSLPRLPRHGPDLGPSLVLRAVGTKGNRRILLDVTFNGVASAHDQSVQVQANALTSATLQVRAEALFTRGDGALVFDDIARTDVDGNGVISPEELRRIDPAPCPKCNADQVAVGIAKAAQDVLADLLHDRAADLFVPE